MNLIEVKVEKILRRLSSKSRRAAQRVSREKSTDSNSSSASECNDHPAVIRLVDRKSVNNRRSAPQKVSHAGFDKRDDEITRTPVATLADIWPSKQLNYFQINVVSAFWTALSGLTSPDNGHLAKVNKSFESEDADCISDHSTCGLLRVRKVMTELDISMDESLPESCGRESGYISGMDLRCSSESSAGSPLFSISRSVKPDSIIPRRLGPAAGHQQLLEEAGIPDYSTSVLLLTGSVAETKYVTTVFELTAGGLVALIDDVLNEFDAWFRDEGVLIGIACEVQWSVPEKHRHRQAEIRMKDALHRTLRQNNLRVLNLKNKTDKYLPLTMTSAVTEENCARNCQLNCFQGVYRRFYASLLPYQHQVTGEWHKPYWNLANTHRNGDASIAPKPEQFIFDNDSTQLNRDSLIAVNVVALKITL